MSAVVEYTAPDMLYDSVSFILRATPWTVSAVSCDTYSIAREPE